MHQFVTISTKESEKISSYLSGAFSDLYRAIPVQHANFSLEPQEVTFQILKNSEIEKPNFFLLFALTLKFKNWLYTLFPLSCVLILFFKTQSLKTDFRHLIQILMSVTGIFLLHSCVSLYNDFKDHMSLSDVYLSRKGSRAIQKGWFSAHQIKKISQFFFASAMLFLLPMALMYWRALWPSGLLLFGILATQYYLKSYRFYRWVSEISVFFLVGPVLTVGFAKLLHEIYNLNLFDSVDFSKLLVLGFFSGIIAFLSHQIKDFENIFTSSQLGLKNIVTELGFDRSKMYLIMLTVLLLVFLQYLLLQTFNLKLVFVISLVMLFTFLWSLVSVKSPVGSNVSKLIFYYRLFTAATCTLMLANLLMK